MGYIVKNGTVQKAHKVSLTHEQKLQMKIPTARQEDIKASILKRREARLVKSA